MTTELLNLSQKRKVTIILRLFEEHLRQAVHWLDGYSEEGLLYRRKLDLPRDNQEKARRKIEEALIIISDLVDQLDLLTEVENPARIIGGNMSLDWANLCDIQALKLLGSGDVHPDLAVILDQPVDQLVNCALTIQKIFTGKNSK